MQTIIIRSTSNDLEKLLEFEQTVLPNVLLPSKAEKIHYYDIEKWFQHHIYKVVAEIEP
jgi:hypothetical protein